jgi:hypothetical protein
VPGPRTPLPSRDRRGGRRRGCRPPASSSQAAVGLVHRRAGHRRCRLSNSTTCSSSVSAGATGRAADHAETWPRLGRPAAARGARPRPGQSNRR